jgi:uncharacterized damage-inducible protein DinB
MISSTTLAEAFNRNVEIIKLQTAGLSQTDSLIQLPFRGNCMNWIVGHILTNRYNVLKLLDAELTDKARLVDRYMRDSAPITMEEEEDVLPLDDLIATLDYTQSQLTGLLAKITPEELERQVAFYGRRIMSVAEWLMFFYFHDTYHTGQTEILRQATGKNDKII